MLLTDSTIITTRENIQILQIDNAFGYAEISLFGGHILSFIPKYDNRERLWVSNKAVLNGKKAIRGGVPVCWPWFGDHKDSQYSAHGYVRDQKWEIISSKETSAGTKINLKPTSSKEDGFTGNALLTLEVLVGSSLNIKLKTENIGKQPFRFNCALHSYFTISDINQCQLDGLAGSYLDKTQGFDIFDTPSPYTFNTETDRIHLNKAQKVDIIDGNQVTSVNSNGHDSMVVWNPWQEKSVSMSDMADDSYLTMVCVETAITQGEKVNAGETHILEQIIN